MASVGFRVQATTLTFSQEFMACIVKGQEPYCSDNLAILFLRLSVAIAALLSPLSCSKAGFSGGFKGGKGGGHCPWSRAYDSQKGPTPKKRDCKEQGPRRCFWPRVPQMLFCVRLHILNNKDGHLIIKITNSKFPFIVLHNTKIYI